MDDRSIERVPQITIAVCTRNRGAAILDTINSIMGIENPDYEVIIVDQSVSSETEHCLQPCLLDNRFRYVRSSSVGLGRARNVALALARAEIVAFTDDDCTVPQDWTRAILESFSEDRRIAVVFSNVVAAPHDTREGFIPAYVRGDSLTVKTLAQKCRARGIGAGISVRRHLTLGMGGFDERLGAGAHFSSCEDGDLAVRALLQGWWVHETPRTAVTHYGFRTWIQGKELTRRDWFGIGAAYSKPIKCGYWSAWQVVVYEGLVKGLLEPLARLIRLQRPEGLKRSLFFWQGFIAGLCSPVDRSRVLFSPVNGDA